MMKFAPWLLCIVLAGLLTFSLYDSHQKIALKDAEIEGLRTRFSQLTAEANLKISEADSKAKKIAEQASAKLQQIAEEANKQIEAANLREVQVKVSFRKALLSSGNVAGITNISGQSIAISAAISRPVSGGGTVREVVLDPGQTREIGQREGWAFLSGDTVTISQPQHKALTFTVP